MIERVGHELDTGERKGYATAIAGLWGGLSHTLARLEEVAAEPDDSLADQDVLASLPGLQYTLHAASEAAAGIEPPADAEASHAELAAALADARDATADVADAAGAGGPEAAWPLVYEWRGALFRVRLARMRIAPQPTPAAPEPLRPRGRALAPVALVVAGAVVLLLGALLDVWMVAAGGLALTVGGLLRGRA
jgi:hypothetical protein